MIGGVLQNLDEDKSVLVAQRGYGSQVAGMQHQHALAVLWNLKEDFLISISGGNVAIDAEIYFAMPGGSVFKDPLFEWSLTVNAFFHIPAPGYIIEQMFLFCKGGKKKTFRHSRGPVWDRTIKMPGLTHAGA
jgi:hypothetical protein